MSKKKKATPDSIVLGISGEALLVMGAIVAFAGRPEWHSALTLALSAVGLVFGLLGYFNIVGVLVSGIPAAAAGVASDIVLAVVSKKEKNKEETAVVE